MGLGAIRDPLKSSPPQGEGVRAVRSVATIPGMNGWELELIVVRQASHVGGERSALRRDVERGFLERLRQGVYVLRVPYRALSVEQQHIVQMRAVAAVAPGLTVFSHVSAGVAHGLPVLRSRLTRVHTTVSTIAERGRDGVAGHVFAVRPSEVVQLGPLSVTSVGRTVVDIAGALPFGEGLMAADAALLSGMPRDLLEEAMDLVGLRRAIRRIEDVIAVAHPGAGSANESMSRSHLVRMGFEPPELQHPLRDHLGLVGYLDFLFRRWGVGGEADGLKKYRDPELAPAGTAQALIDEKLREDRALPLLAGLARWRWAESTSAPRLRDKLGAFGVVPASPPATIADYAAEAREARPRFLVPLLSR